MFRQPEMPSKRSCPNGTTNDNNSAKKPKIMEKDPVLEKLLDDDLDEALSQACDVYTSSQTAAIISEKEKKQAKFIEYRDNILANMKKVVTKKSQSQPPSASTEMPEWLDKIIYDFSAWGLEEIEKVFPDLPQIKKTSNTLRKSRQQAEDPMDTQ